MKNRLYCGDCKEVLNKLIQENIKVDLIYLDPPFNSNAVYNLTYKSDNNKTTAQQKAFSDMWSPTAQTQLMFDRFEAQLEEQILIERPVKEFLKAWITSLKEGNYKTQKLLNYLLYMTERLILMKGLLKDSGSIYLHCDPSASHYLKVIMDGIFGHDNFQNEVIWYYRKWTNAANYFQKNHDVILCYNKNKGIHYFSKIYVEPSDSQKKVIAKGYNVNKVSKGLQLLIYDKNIVQHLIKQGKLKEEDYVNIVDRSDNTLTAASDVWEIQYLHSQSKERLGYPTQKPRALLERIINASCPEGGTVLDPFCGCGTTIDAAVQLKRNWIGIDISTFSVDIIKNRIADNAVNENTYTIEYIRPKTWDEYNKLNAYEKQDFLVKELGGMPNQRKSGDRGIDGELTIHLGINKDKKDIWGKVIFSVKTGKQCSPVMLRELKGTMQDFKADIGILILDKDPSFNMLEEVEKCKKLKYFTDQSCPPQEYNTLQIYTAEQILNGIVMQSPPSMLKIKRYREESQLNLFNH